MMAIECCGVHGLGLACLFALLELMICVWACYVTNCCVVPHAQAHKWGLSTVLCQHMQAIAACPGVVLTSAVNAIIRFLVLASDADPCIWALHTACVCIS